MNRNDIDREIRSTLTHLTGQDTSGITADQDLGDALGLDSLGQLELLAAVEDRHDLMFDEVDMNQARTIAGIAGIVERNLALFEKEAG